MRRRQWLLTFLQCLAWPLFTWAGTVTLPADSAADFKRATDERSVSLDFLKTTTVISDVSTISVFSEINYITPRSWQKKPYVIDAVINTPVPIGGRWFHIPHHGIYFAMQIHPDFVVRILQDDPAKGDSSLPVRTPSFKPGITFFVTCNKLWNTGDGKPKHFFGFKIYHHSNGQDGNHITTAGYWNRYNGDFSDNVIYEFIYGGFSGNNYKAVEPEVMRLWSGRTIVAYNYYWKGLFSLHPPSGLSPEMRAYHIYGYYRTSAQVGFIWAPYYQDYVFSRSAKLKKAVGVPVRKEIFRIYATFDYIWDVGLNTGPVQSLSKVKMYDITKRMNAVVTLSARIPGTPFAGLFLQTGYYASDPYNVYFQQSVLFLRVGLSIGYFVNDMAADKQKGRFNIGF